MHAARHAMLHPTSMKQLIVTALLSASALAHASGLDALETFVKTARSGRAEFTQVVTAPARDRAAGAQQHLDRQLRVLAAQPLPLRLPQAVRADHRRRRPDALAVRRRPEPGHRAPQSQVLGATPAALIAAAPDLASLRRDFDLRTRADRDGLQWVQATPKDQGRPAHQRAASGFRGDELSALEILDSFGQLSVMKFDRLQLNAQVPAGAFDFKPPQGADVLRQ